MHAAMITGHRPQKIPRGSINQIKLALLDYVKDLHARHPDLELVTGMALGTDTWFANVALKLKIPFHAIVPFDGQDVRWRPTDRAHYKHLLNEAKSTQVVATGFSRQAYFDRNNTMVEMSDECIAVWDGSPSGTSHAVGAAQVKGIPLKIINPRSFTQEA